MPSISPLECALLARELAPTAFLANQQTTLQCTGKSAQQAFLGLMDKRNQVLEDKAIMEVSLASGDPS